MVNFILQFLSQKFDGVLSLFVKASHRVVHVDSESDHDVDSDDHREVVKENEKPSDPYGANDVHVHFDYVQPVVHDHESEQSDEGGEEIVEVHQIVKLRDAGVVGDF